MLSRPATRQSACEPPTHRRHAGGIVPMRLACLLRPRVAAAARAQHHSRAHERRPDGEAAADTAPSRRSRRNQCAALVVMPPQPRHACLTKHLADPGFDTPSTVAGVWRDSVHCQCPWTCMFALALVLHFHTEFMNWGGSVNFQPIIMYQNPSRRAQCHGCSGHTTLSTLTQGRERPMSMTIAGIRPL